MRLRHRKWADTVLAANKDIARDLSDFNPQVLANFDHLEIGFGLGGFLLSCSAAHPESRYLGIEVNRNAFNLAVKKGSAVKNSQKNFFLLNSPVERVLPLFQDNQFTAIYINFPDPWPRKRQHHKRLSYPPLLSQYQRLLRKGGKVFFRTDNTDLFQDSLTYFRDSNLYDMEVIDPFYSEKSDILPPTEYETKFRAKGVSIHLLIATVRK